MPGAVIGFDTGTRSLTEVDHIVADLGQDAGLAADAVVCTHLVRIGLPHYAISVSGPGRDPSRVADALHDRHPDATVVVHDLTAERPAAISGALLAVCEAAGRSGGRAVRYPGVTGLVGDVPVRDVLAGTAIHDLQVLGGAGPFDPDDVLQTRDFVRPVWRDGRLVLQVCPAGPGRLAPFEVPDPTPCCGDHPV